MAAALPVALASALACGPPPDQNAPPPRDIQGYIVLDGAEAAAYGVRSRALLREFRRRQVPAAVRDSADAVARFWRFAAACTRFFDGGARVVAYLRADCADSAGAPVPRMFDGALLTAFEQDGRQIAAPELGPWGGQVASILPAERGKREGRDP